MFDSIEETGHEKLAEALTAPIDKVSPVATPNTKKVNPVVESAFDGRKARAASDIAPDRENGGKCHTIDSRHCRKKGDVEVVARKKKVVCHNEPIVFDASTHIDVDVAVAVAVFERQVGH